MNRYLCSDGTRVPKSIVDRKIREAKARKIAKFIEEHGYVYCEVCHKINCVPIDSSHDIPVSECQNSGRTELAWDTNNITLTGRKCHQKKDGLDLKFNNK